MLTTFIISLLFQTAALPPRSAAPNPVVSSPVQKKIQKDFEKLWQRFRVGKDDAKLVKDVDNLLKKNPNEVGVLILSSYLDIYNNRNAAGEAKLEKALGIAP